MTGTGEAAAPATEQEANADAEAAAEAESGTITFTDDLGRTVELPAQIDKICPSGFTAQQVLLTMAPDKMVGLAQELNDDQLKILGEKFADYPVFGAVLGAKDDLNREAVAAAAPQVIIDTGEAKKGAKEDLDALQEQLGIPVIFIEAKLSDYGAAYERLGELLAWKSAEASYLPTAPTSTTRRSPPWRTSPRTSACAWPPAGRQWPERHRQDLVPGGRGGHGG